MSYEDLRQLPWAFATIGGPILFMAIIGGVLWYQRRRTGEPLIGRFSGDERPKGTGARPRRNMSGLGGQGWAFSGWAIPIFAAVIALSIGIYYAVIAASPYRLPRVQTCASSHQESRVQRLNIPLLPGDRRIAKRAASAAAPGPTASATGATYLPDEHVLAPASSALWLLAEGGIGMPRAQARGLALSAVLVAAFPLVLKLVLAQPRPNRVGAAVEAATTAFLPGSTIDYQSGAG